jgi:putative ATP-binding cassette transporter
LNLLEFIQKESDLKIRSSVVLATLSGLANGVILVVIVSTAEASRNGEAIDTQFFLIFLIAILIFVLSKKKIFSDVAKVIESAIRKVRTRIADKVRHSDLQTLEKMGASSIFNSITQDCAQISTSAPVIMNALQSAVMLVFALFYILYLSTLGFIMTGVGILIAAFVYEISRRKVLSTLKNTSAKEREFYEIINHVVNGFKENKVNSKRSSSVMRFMQRLSFDVMKLKTRAAQRESINFLFSQTFFYILLGAIIFLLPILTKPNEGEILRIVTAVLFIVGPVSAVLVVVPLLSRVNIAIQNIYRLEDELSKHISNEVLEDITSEQSIDHIDNPLEFNHEIRLKNIVFEHLNKNDVVFTLGPISELNVNKGEMLFIEGGNGSGKSTLLKVLTGLYYADEKTEIFVDDQLITRYNYPSYRELFSVVFTDFHLTKQLFGLEAVEEEKVKELLVDFKVDHKTEFSNGLLSTVDLSTGQRKRLALIVSLLENKEILIFDEVAADQDPTFKKHYYTELLPALKEKGKTIIVVTHDDMYFEYCDRKLKMVNGNIVQETHYKDGKVTFNKNFKTKL